METKNIDIKLLAQNEGQIQGLPSNPRQWTRTDLDKLKKSIQETPELLEARGLIVYPQGEYYIVIGGNMRLAALRELGAIDAPCIVLPEDTTIDKLKELVIKDNGAFGQNDWDKLANEWSDLPLTAWGVSAWDITDAEQGEDDFDGEGEGDNKSDEEIPEVEEMLNKAMQENCKEFVQQLDVMVERGWIATGYTIGMAKAHFIRSKFYGERYPRWLSMVFHPHQFYTSANTRSMYEQLAITAREGKAGIAGFRTTCEKGTLLTLIGKSGYPIGGARVPLDFPAEMARSLIREFGGENPCVLDPCHGWGGRFVGALLAGARSYTGCDPSVEAHRGLEKMRDAYLEYCTNETKDVQFILSPYEDCKFKEGSFDFALTSPPYFDVEQYHGENQAHTRYPQYDLWKEKFYKPLIENTYKWLKDGCVFALQVGSQSYPLTEDGIAIAKEVGFAVEDVRPLGGSTHSALHDNSDEDDENEKIIILRK